MGGEAKAIPVLVVDDQADSRVLVREMLSDRPEVEVVGEAATGDEALELCAELKPRVVLMDWIMPDGGGPKAATAITAAFPETRVLGFSSGDATHASYELMREGAVGFVSKGSAPDELVDAIVSAARW